MFNNFMLTIWNILFYLSIINIAYIFINLGYKLFLFFKLNQNISFVLTVNEKILLWLSLSVLLTYIT